MQNAVKKMYISMLVLVFVMLTCVATTYAWVGILTNSKFEEFDLNVKSSNLNEYGIEISLDGINFTTEIDSISLKKQILLNYGYKEEQLTNDEHIEAYFARINLSQCTTQPNYTTNKLGSFRNFTNNATRGYFKFDVFISAYKVYETEIVTDYKLDAFLRGDILEGVVGKCQLTNEFFYPSDFVNSTIDANHVISAPKVNSVSASRLAIEKYEVVEKYKPELYDDSSECVDLIIYQGGTQNPYYSAADDVYSFGGIIDDKYNLALFDYNNFNHQSLTVPDWALERGQKELEINEENSQIVDSSKIEEQIGINEMMKLSFYFWFEGWDSDCFRVINKNPVSINLDFSTSYRD